MPIPGSVLGNVTLSDIAALVPELYPSLATLRPLTKGRSAANQVTHSFADSTDPAQVNLACRLSPLILVRPQDQEKQKSDDERMQSDLQLNFASYINVPVQTLLTWQVKVDGTVYQIRSVESDGNRITTRFMVVLVNQFQA